MNKEVYDSIRRINDKEEKLEKIIQNNHLLSSLERYQLVEEFGDKEILTLLKALTMSLSSFSLYSLIGLLKAEENVLEAFLLAKDYMELNDITMLINWMQSPVTKLRMIEMCKNQLPAYSFMNLITSTKNYDIVEKIIDIWGICPQKDDLIKIFNQLQDDDTKKRFVEAFLQNRNISLQRIQEVETMGCMEGTEDSNLDNGSELLFEKASEKEVYAKCFDLVKEEFVIELRDELKFQPSFIYKEMEKMAGIVPGYLQEEALSEIVDITTEQEIGKRVVEY